MNKETYRAQVDAVSFSPDFQDRTMARLKTLAREKEKQAMKKANWRTGFVAAAAAALLIVSAYAAVTLLGPKDVAREAGKETLAAAFESESAIEVNETKTVGDYKVTLMGLVSGEGLNRVENLPNGVTRDKTYAVLAYTRTDGTAITEDVPDLTVSPLVEGYAPWVVNAWTLSGGTSTFAQDGVLYYLFECDNVEPFADRTVYLAVYPGTHIPPSTENFAISDEGHISVADGSEAVLFTLPLDPAKADPQKVAGMGFDTWEPLEMAPTGDEPFNGEIRLTPEEPVENSSDADVEVKDYTQTQPISLPSPLPATHPRENPNARKHGPGQ